MREKLKDSPDSFLGTNVVSEANVDSNNIQNENTKTKSVIDEMTVLKVNETFFADSRTARKKKQKTRAQKRGEHGNREHGQNC